jgi:alkyl hydroperoxide reductase subunit AhpF
VDIVEFAPEVKASRILQEKVARMDNMSVTVNHAIKEFKIENNRLASVIVQDRTTGELKEWQYDGVFVFIGLSPNSDLVKDKVETDRFGFVITDSNLMTTLPGLFAAGDVRLGSTKAGSFGCRRRRHGGIDDPRVFEGSGVDYQFPFIAI